MELWEVTYHHDVCKAWVLYATPLSSVSKYPHVLLWIFKSPIMTTILQVNCYCLHCTCSTYLNVMLKVTLIRVIFPKSRSVSVRVGISSKFLRKFFNLSISLLLYTSRKHHMDVSALSPLTSKIHVICNVEVNCVRKNVWNFVPFVNHQKISLTLWFYCTMCNIFQDFISRKFYNIHVTVTICKIKEENSGYFSSHLLNVFVCIIRKHAL